MESSFYFSILARKGNLTERIVGVLVSIVLSIPAVVGALYLILWQTYVLRIDVILAAIQVVLIGLELVFGIISMITFARYVLRNINWYTEAFINTTQTCS